MYLSIYFFSFESFKIIFEPNHGLKGPIVIIDTLGFYLSIFELDLGLFSCLICCPNLGTGLALETLILLVFQHLIKFI